MEEISKYQLGAMIVLFQIGSTPLFELGIKVKQDAWLVIITGIFADLLLLQLFLAIQRREPEKSLFHILIQYFGPFLGKATAFLYVLLFTYESMRNVRDFGELTIATLLSRTPLSFIMLVLMVLAGYALYKGIEVFFRFAEFLVSGVLFGYMILMVMSFISGKMHFDNLLPIMENGIVPIFKESYFSTIWFPFGQMMVFLIYWSYVNEKNMIPKTSFRAYFISAVVILVMNIINLAMLGPKYADISMIPLLQSVQLIQIADIFERFDAVIILLFYAGILIKATLWYLAAIIGLGQLFHTDYRKFIIPVGAVIYGVSFMPENWRSHLKVAHLVADRFQMNPIMLFAIPFILYITMLIRRNSIHSQ